MSEISMLAKVTLKKRARSRLSVEAQSFPAAATNPKQIVILMANLRNREPKILHSYIHETQLLIM